MKRKVPWIIWLVSTIVMVTFLANLMRDDEADRSVFLPGVTTAGHYQIELACASCHTPMGGVKQDACMTCHAAELERASDSHPPKKFKPLDKAELVERLDARYCITCHQEHAADRTHAMGVTMPTDYCYHCHSDIATTRPNHAGFAFDSCATAGCHNFHDNRGLNEPFLTKHLEDPDYLDSMHVAKRTTSLTLADASVIKHALAGAKADAPAAQPSDPAITAEWAASAHARAGVNCTTCHVDPAADDATAWIERPDHNSCARCHTHETEGFLAGRHGMRLAAGMSPMTPAMARLPMKPDAADHALSCVSCHGPHGVDVTVAAAQSCATCHDDPHTRAYDASPHALLWRKELAGNAPAGSGVSCATCHLPREVHRDSGGAVTRVQHNQNDNLRPNEKMLRNVCVNCHGVEFSLDALADRDLIDRNFAGRPGVHVESLDLIRQKIEQTERKRSERDSDRDEP